MTEAHPKTKPLADALARRGYDQLTPVQTEMMRPDLAGLDMLVSAQTGSGKTVGFGLALAPTLLDDALSLGPAGSPLALIIAPTRELALQVKREFEWLYMDAGARIASTVGGMDMRDERRALDRGAHIVVATPGRLVDHIKRGSLDMSDIRAVVLDEADEMLDLGFREDLEYILSEAPAERQTLMFSATVPRAIADLSKTFLKPDAQRISTTTGATQHADIEYRALAVAPGDEERAIINLLRYYEAQNAIVFANTRAMVNRLTARFSNRGFSVVALSGELSQAERTHALQAMRDGRARVCVATDVAARGIDLPNLELVVHAELPSNSETLMHRSGRTGRAGRKGVSALIVPAKARGKAERLLKGAKINAEWDNAPTADEVRAKDEERLLSDPVWTEAVAKEDRDFIGRLTAEHGAEQIAAAYMKLYRQHHSAPEELNDPGARAPKREPRAFGPSKWLKVSIGAKDRVEARWLLPLLCRAGDITREDIGAIRVQDAESYVELTEAAMPGFLAAIGPEAKLEDGATVTVMASAPDLGSMPRPAAQARKAHEGKPHRGASERPRPPRPEGAPRGTSRKSFPDKAFSDKAESAPYVPPAVTSFDPVVPAGDAPKPRKPRATPVEAYHPDTGAPAGVELPKTREEKAAGSAPKPARAPYVKSDSKPPYAKSGAKPAAKPYVKSGDKPYSKSTGKPSGKPAGKPSGKPTGKPYEKSGDKPYSKGPSKGPGVKPYSKPAEGRSGDAPAAKPYKSRAANPSAKLGPGGKPIKPGSKPASRGPNAVPRRKP